MVKVSLRLEQKIKLSQMQRLTIKMMSLRGQDLQDFLHEQVTDNPLLDIRYRDVRRQASSEGNEKPIDNIRSRGESLEEKLMKELRVQQVEKPILLAAGLIIQALDDKGFFQGDLEEIGMPYHLSLADMQEGLMLVQSFEPPGIGARSIRECLLIQTKRKKNVPKGTVLLLTEFYDDFIHGRWQRIEKEMDLSNDEIKAIRDFLKKLPLSPAPQADESTSYIRADIEIFCDDQGKLQVRSLEELPEVFFRDDLFDMYKREHDKATQKFIHKAKRQFLDLQTALAYRWQSILRVTAYILHQQEPYFLYGENLRPLTQVDIAEGTGLSTATVSRVCKDRYVLFKKRIYPVQDFLANYYRDDSSADGSISDKAIMKEMVRLIEEEDKQHPWSDQDIAQYLNQKNIHIARRTVTKFRLKMNIPNSNLRKRLKNV